MMPLWLWIVLAWLALDALLIIAGARHQSVRRHPTNAMSTWRKRRG